MTFFKCALVADIAKLSKPLAIQTNTYKYF